MADDLGGGEGENSCAIAAAGGGVAPAHVVVITCEKTQEVAAVAAYKDHGGAANVGDGVEEVYYCVAGTRVAEEVGAVVVEVEGYGLCGLHTSACAEASAAAEGMDGAVSGIESSVSAVCGERACAVCYYHFAPWGVRVAEETEVGCEDWFELGDGRTCGVDACAQMAAMTPSVALKVADNGFLKAGGLTTVPFYE